MRLVSADVATRRPNCSTSSRGAASSSTLFDASLSGVRYIESSNPMRTLPTSEGFAPWSGPFAQPHMRPLGHPQMKRRRRAPFSQTVRQFFFHHRPCRLNPSSVASRSRMITYEYYSEQKAGKPEEAKPTCSLQMEGRVSLQRQWRLYQSLHPRAAHRAPQNAISRTPKKRQISLINHVTILALQTLILPTSNME